MKKLLLILVLGFTMGHLYSQNYSGNYLIDWREKVGSITLKYPQTGTASRFNLPNTGTVLRFQVGSFDYIGDFDAQNNTSRYIIQQYSHVPCLSIETIYYSKNVNESFIELYLSENKESSSRKLTFVGGSTYIEIIQAGR